MQERKMKTLLDYFYHWENETPNKVWLTQPIGDGKIKTWTWKEAGQEARRMASYLKSLNFPEKSHIAICSKNCAWWLLADLAIWMAGHVSVPVHAVLTEKTVRYTLENSQARILFVGKMDPIWEEMKKGVPAALPKIAFPLAPDNSFDQWDQVITDVQPAEGQRRRAANEMATIIYTSGSTGTPKGAMVSFDAMFQSAKGFCKTMSLSDERFISYMPLSHVYERLAVESISLFSGSSLWFSESINIFLEDVKRARPTIFYSVPRLWTKFQLGIFEKVPPKKLSRLLKIPLINRLVKKKILKGIGLDCTRFGFSAGAPMPKELIGWYRKLGLEVLDVYAMTENFGYSHFVRPGNIKPGYVGSPHYGVEHKLSDQGEILVKSPGLMTGYFNNPEATENTFDENGFLRTGDLGFIDESGDLKVIGRLKEEFKTAKGKYVSPAPIECTLSDHPMVETCLVSGSGQAQPYGIILLSSESQELVINGEKKKIEKELSLYLQKVNSKLTSHEKLAFLVVSKENWTPENGLMTPTMKVKRGKIEKVYSAFTDHWFNQKQEVVWMES